MTEEPGREDAQAQPSSARKQAGWERPTRIGVASLALIAIMFLFVFPTRSYLAQQQQVRGARHKVEVLESKNKELGRQEKLLQTPAEIERMARVQFNMVFPGEQAFNVVTPEKPKAAPTTTLP